MAGLKMNRSEWKSRHFFAGTLLAYATLIAPAPAEMPAATLAPGSPQLEAGQPQSVEGHFSLVVPPGWGRADTDFGLSADEKRAWGLTLYGPWRGDVRLRIAVHYYGNGGLQYGSISHYLNVFAKPALGVALEGSEYGQITDVKFAGRSAKL